MIISPHTWPYYHFISSHIYNYTRRQIYQDRMIFDFSVNSEPISWNFAKAIFYSNPNSGKNFAKLYLLFQKLDHLTCNKILELV